MKLKAKYKPGQDVIVAGEIRGWIESVAFYRDSPYPTYRVRYWINGSTTTEELLDKDIEGIH